jgi:membrane-associated phospholipid phosphatase
MMRTPLGVLVIATLAAMAIFAIWPDIDLTIARTIYRAGGGAFAGHSGLDKGLRAFFNVTPFVILAAFALAWLMGRIGVATPFAVSGRALAFLIASLAIGPGLVVNVGLKDHMHRPRPVHLVEFGGAAEFRPWDSMDGACRKNCSFPSGEVAESFWLVAPASLAPPPWRAPAIGAALVFGVATAALRMAFGGHFLSDAVLGALLTMIAVVLARRAFGIAPSSPAPTITPGFVAPPLRASPPVR